MENKKEDKESVLKEDKELEASLYLQKCFNSLYLEVEPSIVSSVKEAVYTVIKMLEDKVKQLSPPTVLTDEALQAESEEIYPMPSFATTADNNYCMGQRQAHIKARKMSLQLTQQERRNGNNILLPTTVCNTSINHTR